MPPVAFQGRIPVTGHTAPTLSPFKSTNWDNDAATVPGQTAMAFKSTDWADDDDNAEPQVRGFNAASDNWS